MRAVMLKCLGLLALLACAPLAHAQIYHCVGAHGEPAFSGQPCGAPATGATPGTPATGSAHFRGVCAESPDALRAAIKHAFDTHDVNRLAGLILWRGMDHAATRATMHALTAWLQQPLAGIAIAYAGGAPPDADAASAPAVPPAASIANASAPPPDGFRISTGGADGDTRDFGVTELGGCWWLTF